MTDRQEIEDLVKALANARGPGAPSLAIAESCTGGMICAAIVANPDVSGGLERGFIVYSLDSKCELLDLDRAEVESCEGVSRDVAIGMAEAGLRRSHADLALSVTGFAGPQQNDEEVGLVHVALARKRREPLHAVYHFGDLGREVICNKAVVAALQMLLAQSEGD
ncbi:CinA family protein [Qipengyuania atrilutea]|uniref:CinA family protein n=1 Tax=Qipengyuania atrilutea TaxID=2744473 RepID=A0A850HET2_9SPHN|nr:CinA family protein [Actirhodobacter atriluteus]NVD45769.1 CinA family protein [Actirhodobacter atriluteus]